MKITYDSTANVAYIALRPKRGRVRTVSVSDELNIDLAADGTIYGIELLNANEQLASGPNLALQLENKSSGESREIAIAV